MQAPKDIQWVTELDRLRTLRAIPVPSNRTAHLHCELCARRDKIESVRPSTHADILREEVVQAVLDDGSNAPWAVRARGLSVVSEGKACFSLKHTATLRRHWRYLASSISHRTSFPLTTCQR